MQRMCRRMFAVVAALAVAGAAPAQDVPSPMPAARPDPSWSLTAVPATPAQPVPLPAPSVGVVPASGGFNGVSVRGLPPRAAVSAVVNQPPIPYGCYGGGCANGCGNYKSDLGFIFGSCKSYFDPCGPLPCNGVGGCGRLGGKCGGLFHNPCPTLPFGKPYNVGCPGCAYDSVLNH